MNPHLFPARSESLTIKYETEPDSPDLRYDVLRYRVDKIYPRGGGAFLSLLKLKHERNQGRIYILLHGGESKLNYGKRLRVGGRSDGGIYEMACGRGIEKRRE